MDPLGPFGPIGPVEANYRITFQELKALNHDYTGRTFTIARGKHKGRVCTIEHFIDLGVLIKYSDEPVYSFHPYSMEVEYV